MRREQDNKMMQILQKTTSWISSCIQMLCQNNKMIILQTRTINIFRRQWLRRLRNGQNENSEKHSCTEIYKNGLITLKFSKVIYIDHNNV